MLIQGESENKKERERLHAKDFGSECNQISQQLKYRVIGIPIMKYQKEKLGKKYHLP